MIAKILDRIKSFNDFIADRLLDAISSDYEGSCYEELDDFEMTYCLIYITRPTTAQLGDKYVCLSTGDNFQYDGKFWTKLENKK